MIEGLIARGATCRTEMWAPEDIIVLDRQRNATPEGIAKVRKSMAALGNQMQLQPLILSDRIPPALLIDGAHRLEAAKLEGWSHVRVEIWSGLTEADEKLLEAESNYARNELSIVEIEKSWTEVLEPFYRARAKERQAVGHANLRQGTEAAPVMRIPHNRETPKASGSLRTLASEITGVNLDTSNKVTDIRHMAESTTAPPELVTIAQRGLEKLQTRGASVNAVHKEILKRQERAAAVHNPGEAEARRREKLLDQLVNETTLLAERLGDDLAEDLRAAAGVNEMGREQLRSARVALTHSLSRLVVIECLLADDPVPMLRTAGSEVTKMLRDITAKGLELEVEDGNH
ncbi:MULTISPECIES: hypothetical protein [unclassified Leucobacter]|uniref:hypothetical protein n=1 Tax=unclassified Leucobacter TaxID=2621730 RepID=UPI003016861B